MRQLPPLTGGVYSAPPSSRRGCRRFGRFRRFNSDFPRFLPAGSGERLCWRSTARGKRYLCAKCRKRSPRPVKTPAPWYCPRCLAEREAAFQ